MKNVLYYMITILNLISNLKCNLYQNTKRLLTNTQNKNITFPLKQHNNKLYLDLSIGIPPQNISILIDTGSSKSVIFKSNKNDSFSNSIYYDEKTSENFVTYNKIENFGKFYVDYNFNNSDNLLDGIISYDTIKFDEKYEIKNYQFILANNNNTNYNLSGILAISRDKNQPKLFNFLSQFIINDYIEKENFLITRNNSITFGDFKFNENVTMSNCNLFEYDSVLSNLWACNISHINFNNNKENNIDELFRNNFRVNSFAIFDTSIDDILIPLDAKIEFSQFHNNTNETMNNNLKNENVLLVDYLNNTIFNQKCNLHQDDSEILTLGILNVFKCNNTINEFKNISEINFILNGFGYIFKLEDLFDLESKTFKIKFYQQNENQHSFWIFGNIFLKNFDAIEFSNEKNMINFYGGNFHNFTNFTKDLKEVQPIFTFFILSIICVIVLIIVVLLVPYLLYRQRKKAMMEKLQYDVIYKKMDDITRELNK